MLCIMSPNFAHENQTQVFAEIDSDVANFTFEHESEVSESPVHVLHNTDFESGEELCLENAEYEYQSSTCSLNKVSVVGEDCENTIIHFNNLTVVASDVNLRNLTISGANFKNQGNFIAENVIFKNSIANPIDEYFNSYGGSIYTEYSNSYKSYKVSLKNCTFMDNSAEFGGAIYVNGGELEIDNCMFINNYAIQYGGAIAIENANKVKIRQSKFINDCSLYDAGGAIYIIDSTLNAENLTISNCSALLGGAIGSLSSDLDLNHIQANDNIAAYDGGAIYQIYGETSIKNSHFKDNHANNGGALFLDDITKTVVINNNFTNNTALNCAGALYSLANSKMKIENNTFENNGAQINNDTYFISIINQILRHLNYTQFIQKAGDIESLPSYYSLVDEGYVSPVKDQEDGGNCWAFAFIAALESSILKATNITYDLSEGNMKNLMAYYSDYGWNKKVNDGGVDEMAISYLASWLGPILEEYDLTDARDAISPLISPLTHVQDIIFIKRNNYLDNDIIKEAIMKYGAVVTGMHYDDDYLRDSSYYYSGHEYADHEVLIVGWDDNYSRYKFDDTPKGNGAFIVKNSWADDWGDNGYFYVSYYDAQFACTGEYASYVFPFNNDIRYEKNYQYDISGRTDYLSTSKKTVWYENIFNSTEDELLAGVSTYFDTETSWEVYVYVNDLLKTKQSGTASCGYYTIPLKEFISLKKGDVFKVVFKITTKKSARIPISEADNFNKLSFTRGVSFISLNGNTWKDLYDYEVHPEVACIKAFTIVNKLNTDLKLNISEKGVNSIKLKAIVSDMYGNMISTGKVMFNVDNEQVIVNVSEGIALLDYSFKDIGEYEITAEFISDYYNPSNATCHLKMGGILDFSINNITYGEKISVIVNLTDLEGNKLSDKLNLTISDKSYLFEGNMFSVDDKFDAGDYEAILTVNSLKVVKKFTVYKKESQISINIKTRSGEAIISVLVNDKINHDVILSVDGKNYTLGNNGKVLISNLRGQYTAVANWLGDKNYYSSQSAKDFTVFCDPELKIEVDDMYVGETAVVKISIRNDIQGEVIVMLNDRDYKVNESMCVLISDLVSGEYTATAYYYGDEYYLASIDSATFEVKNYEVQILPLENQVSYSMTYSVLVKGFDGKNAGNVEAKLNIGNEVITSVTNAKGIAYFKITQTPATYKISVFALGKTVSSTLKVNQILHLKKVKVKKSSKKLVIKATLDKVNGKYLKNQKITFKFNGKKYTAKTNKKGVAKVTIKKNVLKKLKVGKKVIYQASYGKIIVKKTAKIKK